MATHSDLFGGRTRTGVLLALALLEETHAAELARLLGAALSGVQRALAALETDNVISGVLEGRAKRFRLNPRFYAREELRALLDRLVLAEPELIAKAAELRRRPRRAGKAL